MPFSPTRAPNVRHVSDIFHLDVRVHKTTAGNFLTRCITMSFPYLFVKISLVNNADCLTLASGDCLGLYNLHVHLNAKH